MGIPNRYAESVSVKLMQAIDRAAIETVGIPRVLLMDHAGLALANAVQARFPDQERPVLVLAGAGYNGGDGLSAARHLKAMGWTVEVLLAAKPAQLRDEPRVFAGILEKLGVPLTEAAGPADSEAVRRKLDQTGVVVDALLGIGLRGPVREPFHMLIGRVNAAGKPVVAADVPSGLDADTGAVLGACVRAKVTVAFGRVKQGCLAGEGPAHCGEIVVEPITLPPQLFPGGETVSRG